MNRIAAVVAGLSLAFVGTGNVFAGDNVFACCIYNDADRTMDCQPSATEEDCLDMDGIWREGKATCDDQCNTFVVCDNPGTPDCPYQWARPTIVVAIQDAHDGDLIHIPAGTYPEHSLDTDGKAITILGELHGDGSLATTIDAGQLGPVFIIESGEGRHTQIIDLKITNGDSSGTQAIGGGIHCFLSHPKIIGCTISSNICGIYCQGNNDDNNPMITGCTIEDNSDAYGGGISALNSNVKIINCMIRNNNASYGGGIWCYGDSTPIITGCTFWGNTATEIGAGFGCNDNVSPCFSSCSFDLYNDISIGHNCTLNPSFCSCEEGDMDGDGDVDADDVHLVEHEAGICHHDTNGDGITNIIDVLEVIIGWGASCAP